MMQEMKVRALVSIAMILATAGAAAAKPRTKIEVRLDPKVATQGAHVEVYLLNAGTTTWSHHSPGGSDGCARPLRATVVRRARHTEMCTEALVGPKDTTLAAGQSTWADTLDTGELAPGTYTIAVEGVTATATLRVTK